MKNITVIVFIALAGLVLGPLPASAQIFFVKDPSIGREAKEFTLRSLNGREASLSELREGKKAIVFFWATWCPHCREALAELDERKEQVRDLGIEVIIIDGGESEKVVRSYIEKNKIEMDIFLDEASEVADMYGVIGIPVFYFIGEDGIVRNVLNSLPQDLENVFYGG